MQQSTTPRPDASFGAACAALDGFDWRRDVQVEQIPAPSRIAPFAHAVSVEVQGAGSHRATGRLVLLHDPAGQEAWAGTLRWVTLARADTGEELASDPLLAELAWGWLTDALDEHDAAHRAASGTVTAVTSRSFGGLQGTSDHTEVELRASWTPLADPAPSIARHDFTQHLAAWQDLLCRIAGLSPLPAGVVPLARTRRRQGPST